MRDCDREQDRHIPTTTNRAAYTGVWRTTAQSTIEATAFASFSVPTYPILHPSLQTLAPSFSSEKKKVCVPSRKIRTRWFRLLVVVVVHPTHEFCSVDALQHNSVRPWASPNPHQRIATHPKNSSFKLSLLASERGKLDLAKYLLEEEHVPVTAVDPATVLAKFHVSYVWSSSSLTAGNKFRIAARPGHSEKQADQFVLRQRRPHQVPRRTRGAHQLCTGTLRDHSPAGDCAIFGSVSTFKCRQANGAKLGTRTLHRSATHA